MASPFEHIVDFEQPPVAEVALAVQLREPALDAATTLSKFWPKVIDEYPRIEPQPPLPPMEENFEIPAPAGVSFHLMGGPEAMRYFLVSVNERELLQVQADRFGYNWRKEQTEEPYPRYQHVRERFRASYTAYQEIVEGMEKELHATWCEITYVNPVYVDAGQLDAGQPRPDLSTLIARVVPQELSVLPRPYNTALSERFQLTRDGEPYARFYIDIESTVRRLELRLGYTITLTMRGRPLSPDLDGVLSFFDEGRSTIVQTFRDITTPERHAEWGLR
jgi:uncharacterized protein (TIGR04255 family)